MARDPPILSEFLGPCTAPPWVGVLYSCHPHMPVAPGARLGAYEIVAPVGEGGMGEVYQAHDAEAVRISELAQGST